MKKSVFVVVFLLVFSLLSLTGCMNNDKLKDSQLTTKNESAKGLEDEAKTEDEATNEPVVNEDTNLNGAVRYDGKNPTVKEDVPIKDVYKFENQEDFVVKIEGKEYTFPISQDAFEGWVLNDTEGELKPSQYAIGYSLKKEGYVSIGVTPYNNTSENKSMLDCVIGSISITKGLGSVSKNLDIELPLGITLGSSYVDVIDAYGEPTKDNINSSNPSLRSLVYEIETYKNVKLDLSNDKVTDIKIQYID